MFTFALNLLQNTLLSDSIDVCALLCGKIRGRQCQEQVLTSGFLCHHFYWGGERLYSACLGSSPLAGDARPWLHGSIPAELLRILLPKLHPGPYIRPWGWWPRHLWFLELPWWFQVSSSVPTASPLQKLTIFHQERGWELVRLMKGKCRSFPNWHFVNMRLWSHLFGQMTSFHQSQGPNLARIYNYSNKLISSQSWVLYFQDYRSCKGQ